MKLQDAFSELQKRSEDWLTSTSLIYGVSEGQPDSFGTGIFFAHRGHHFIVSAAHVLSELNDRLLYIGTNQLLPMTGPFFTTEDANIDLGFWPLSEAHRHAFTDARFLTVNEVELAGTDGDDFYVVGFRAEDNPRTHGNRVLSKGSVYGVKGASTEKYSPLGLSPETHLLIGFDLTTMHSSPTQREEPEAQPRGMSGCGVWRLTPSVKTDRLVAILTEHSNAHNAVVSTRLHGLITALDDYAEGTLSTRT